MEREREGEEEREEEERERRGRRRLGDEASVKERVLTIERCHIEILPYLLKAAEDYLLNKRTPLRHKPLSPLSALEIISSRYAMLLLDIKGNNTYKMPEYLVCRLGARLSY